MNGNKNPQKVRLILIGAGGRGTIYARLSLLMAHKGQVVAVAEPRDFFRDRIAKICNIPAENCFPDWHEVLLREKFADAVVITTQDQMHVEPSVAFARKGYHILLEKPLAPDAESCRRIVETVHQNNVMLSLCHVMRYATYTKLLRDMIRDGAIGKIISVQLLEPVGHWRFAHSYVRGNWNREEKSSSILMAKSIHDLDWICFIMGQKCTKLSSFGALTYFHKGNRPADAADRCLDCPREEACPYSARRFYLERFRENRIDNYIESVVDPLTEENILDALRSGPYGRCVFACDNDVVDHQVVNMEFEDKSTAVFTLAGCSLYDERRATIFGSEGEIRCDGSRIRIFSYRNNTVNEIPIAPDQGTLTTHHNGGDLYCLEAFVDAVASGDERKILTGPEESLHSYNMVFAAEISRKTGTVVSPDALHAASVIPG